MQFPELCRQCGGLCCHHPVRLTEKEYIRICNMTSREIDAEPVVDGWRQFSSCPLLTDEGCSLDHDDRPIVCQVHPFVLLKSGAGYILLLAVQECPFWPVFGSQYKEAEEKLRRWMRWEYA